jgi:hypothetical protein
MDRVKEVVFFTVSMAWIIACSYAIVITRG